MQEERKDPKTVPTFNHNAPELPTMRVVVEAGEGEKRETVEVTINRADFDPKVHKPAKGETAPPRPAK